MAAAPAPAPPPLLLLLLIFFFFFFFLLAHFSSMASAWSSCERSCGGIPLSYPFGGAACGGNSLFDLFINCSHGHLFLHTPTGRYPVQSIDYTNSVIIVLDSKMATCEDGGAANGASFGLPVGAPFSFAASNQVALLGCVSTPALQARQTCDPAKQDLCTALYAGCSALCTPSSLHTSIATSSPSNSVTVPNIDSTCCVLSDAALSTAPYDVDLALLQCSAFVSVYHVGALHDPLDTWLYGIALQFYPGASSKPGGGSGGDHPSCYVCEEALDSGASVRAAPMGRLWSAGLAVAATTVALQLRRLGVWTAV